MVNIDPGHFSCGNQKVVGERYRQRLSVGIEDHLLVKRIPDTVGNAADDLPVDQFGIDHAAAIVSQNEILQVHLPRPGIDFDFGDRRAV